MPGKDKSKRSRFLGFVKIKKKTPIESFHKHATPVAEAINALPKGSTQATEFKLRIRQIMEVAKAGENPKKALAKLKKDALAAAKQVEQQAPTSVISGPIQDEVAEKMVAKVDEMYDFGPANKLLTPHLAAVNTEIDKLGASQTKLRDAIKRLDVELESVATKFDGRVKTLVQSKTKPKGGDDLRVEANKIDATVKDGTLKGKELATAVLQFSKKLGPHLSSVTSDVAALCSEINSAAADTHSLPALAREAKLDQDNAKLLAAYRKKISHVDKKVSELEDWGSPDAARMRGLWKTNSPDAPPDVNAAIDSLDDVLVEIAKSAKAQRADYDKEAQKLKTRLATVDDKIARLVISIQLQANSDWEKAFNAQTKKEVEVITLMIGNGANKEALAGAETMIASLEARASDLDANLKEMINLGELQYECKQVLKSSKATKMCPDLTLSMSEEFEKLEADALKQAASTAIVAFKALKVKVVTGPTSLATKASERETWLKAFNSKAKKLDKALPTMLKAMKSVVPSGSPDFFKTYYGPLATDLENARNLAKEESKLSMDAADALLTKIELAVVATVKALQKNANDRNPTESALCMDAMKGQNDGIAAEKKRKEDEAAFDKDYQKFKDRYASLSYYIETYKPHMSGEMKATRQLSKNAKDVMKSSHDLERARKVLAAATTKMERVYSEAKMEYAKLASISKLWVDTIKRVDDGIDKIGAAVVAKVATSDDPELKKAAAAVGATLKGAAKYLDPKAFDEAAKTYSKKDASATELVKTREQTLNQIRVMKEFISNDHLIRAAQGNPFGVKNVVSPIFAALRDFEYKVMISA